MHFIMRKILRIHVSPLENVYSCSTINSKNLSSSILIAICKISITLNHSFELRAWVIWLKHLLSRLLRTVSDSDFALTARHHLNLYNIFSFLYATRFFHEFKISASWKKSIQVLALEMRCEMLPYLLLKLFDRWTLLKQYLYYLTRINMSKLSKVKFAPKMEESRFQLLSFCIMWVSMKCFL